MRVWSAGLTAVATLLLAVTLPAIAAEASAGAASPGWPQWRGPNRDAISPETGLLHAWPEGGPKVAWRIPVGPGFSSVSIQDGRACTAWDEEATQVLGCLDSRTGKEIWRHTLGAAFTHPYGDGPRSTPLVAGGTVFAIGTAGQLVALEAATGKVVWTHDLVKEFQAKLPSYGYASSPLLAGGKLLVEVAGTDGSYIAFDVRTGKVVWTAAHDRPAYSSPISVSIGGVPQVVFWSGAGLHSLEADSGTILWDHPWETLCPVSGEPLNTGTPIFLPPDRIFLASGSGATVIRIGKADGRFAVETVWTSTELRSDVNTSVIVGDHVYGFDRGTLKCLDVRTGDLRWKARGYQKGSLIAADGRLIVLAETGKLALVEASPEAFVETSSAQVLEGRCWTVPALSDGRLYLRNHDELVALDLRG